MAAIGQELLLEVNGPIATIALARPAARNALTLAMLEGLTVALQACGARRDVRVVVLRGAGELPFSAGYNLDELPAHQLDADDARAIHAPVRAAAAAIMACPHPVVGAARGFVFGAGLDLFAHCDLRLACDDARFCMPPNKYGFLYPQEGLAGLVAAMGLARATQMILTGAIVGAAEAHAWSLVHSLCPAQQFEETLAALCGTLAANAPLSMQASKQALLAWREQVVTPAASAALYAQIAACLNSADVREAMNAFRAKRPPVFTGQ